MASIAPVGTIFKERLWLELVGRFSGEGLLGLDGNYILWLTPSLLHDSFTAACTSTCFDPLQQFSSNDARLIADA